tara:strand:- start:377 stop:550 length:174 start_codon:yes stop_codon:yes gene_type:complete
VNNSSFDHDKMPHKDGAKAFNDGYDRSSNPHKAETWQYEEWDFGWKTEEECSDAREE